MRFEDHEGRTYAFLESGRLVFTDAAPAHFQRCDRLDLSGNQDLKELPDRLCVDKLLLRGCTGLKRLPDGLDVNLLSLANCTGITTIPAGLTCNTLNLQGTAVRSLPDDLRVTARLDLTDCRELTRLPVGLRIGWLGMPSGTPTGSALILRRCTALEFLPDRLDVCHLDARGCSRLLGWRDGANVRVRRLIARDCARLKSLPAQLALSRLDVTGCAELSNLPDGLRVDSEIEVADSGLTSLPASLSGVGLRWRGVPISRRVAFEPESITVEEILSEPNAELRRVLLERMGLERFLTEADAELLDEDRDAGGERKLLRVSMNGDEDLLCVLVHCPSTSRQYILRVPPTMKTCRQAIAWTAGFDDPEDYRPLVET
jgi:hypothetical protein